MNAIAAPLRERAEKLGYRLIRRGPKYRLIDKDSEAHCSDRDGVEWQLDVWEGKRAMQASTACGMIIPGMNNSEAWLAAHPGKTMEDFEAAHGQKQAISGERAEITMPEAADSCEATPAIVAEVDIRGGRELVPARSVTTLEQWAESINEHLDKAEESEASASSHRLRAGQALIEVRGLIPHGEWESWCEANIKRSMRDIRRLMKIAGADDPEAALGEERAKTREGMAALRADRTNVSPVDDAPTPQIVTDEDARNPNLQKMIASLDGSPKIRAWLRTYKELRQAEKKEAYNAFQWLIAMGGNYLNLALRYGNVKTDAAIRALSADVATPVEAVPLTPAELFAAAKPSLEAMSDDDVREFGKMITQHMIDRPESALAGRIAQNEKSALAGAPS